MARYHIAYDYDGTLECDTLEELLQTVEELFGEDSYHMSIDLEED